MKLNGSVVKCDCGGDLFRVLREVDELYAVEKTVCVACDAVVIETEMDA